MTLTVFGYLISNSISSDFTILFLKHLKCIRTFPNTSKFVKNTPLRVVFSTLVFGNVVKRSFSCLIYYFPFHKNVTLKEEF